MHIKDRFRGDTNPLVMFLYYKGTDNIEYPVELLTTNSSVIFSYRKGSVTQSINGINMTDEGEVHFPFAEDSADAGEYQYDVQVINGDTAEKKTYVVDIMTINPDVTKA